jgi:hypothetical protein
MINIITNYLFHPVVIYCKIWRYAYILFINVFNLPINNQDNYRNSHVISLIYSIITTCLTPYTFYVIYNNYFLENQINLFVTEFIYNISLSYFISDLVVGIQFYPNVLNSSILTSYVHHTAYISLLVYGKYYNKLYLFILGMPYEIPTILLNLRYVSETYKNYKLFGILFLVFRIFYNMFLLYKTFNVHNDMFIFCVCTFILHVYWYSIYVKKYILRN